MTIERILEPEVMDTREEAVDYNAMDHSEVNVRFVEELLEFARTARPEGVVPDEANQLRDFDPNDATDYTLGDVLDPGTGTALIPIELCSKDHHGRVMAIDMATNMLDVARGNVQFATLEMRIPLSHMDGKAMRFPAGMFDTVMSNSIIHHIPEPIECLKEMVRVSRGGGILFVRDLMRPVDELTLETIVNLYAGEENEHSQQMFRESLWAALTLDEIRGLVASLGFSESTVTATSDRHWTWAATKE